MPSWGMMPAVVDTTGFFQLAGEGLPDDAQTRRYRAVERVSCPYEVVIDFSTMAADFDAAELLRRQLSLLVVDAEGSRRIFDGIVEEAVFVDVLAAASCP